MKALAIDREATNRVLYEMLLKDLGYEVVTCMTCGDGISQLKSSEGKFGIVITEKETSDIPLDVNGFTVIQEVKLIQASGGKTKVILAANSLTLEEQDACMILPPDAFLQKPFEQGFLRGLVRFLAHD